MCWAPRSPGKRRCLFLAALILVYGNDSRQNGPFGLRGSNSPLLEVKSKIARRRRWFITWRFCTKRECGLTFTNHTEHPVVQEAGFTSISNNVCGVKEFF